MHCALDTGITMALFFPLKNNELEKQDSKSKLNV